MRTRRFFPTVCLLLASALPVGAAEPGASVVKVIALLSYPNPLQPWAKGKAVEVTGTGVVIEGKRSSPTPTW
jgi:hypothetical protein